MRLISFCAVGLLVGSAWPGAAVQVVREGDVLVLRNGLVQTTFNLANGAWQASDAAGHQFASDLRCTLDAGGRASTMEGRRTFQQRPVADAFGKGVTVEISEAATRPFVLVLTMYDDQPFFLVQVRVPNAAGLKVREATLAEGKYFIGEEVRRVCALVNYWSGEWYSEIHPVDLTEHRNRWETYSHFYWCGYNRGDEHSVILGALYSEGANRIEATVEPARDPRAVFLKPRCFYDKNPLTATNAVWRSPPYFVGSPKNVFQGLEAYGAVARAYRPVPLTSPPPTGWCSWDAGASSSQKELFANVDAMKAHRLDEYGLKIVQLDDGWQQGERCSGRWRPRLDRFPAGMKGVADYIRAKGFEPGLWIGPFGEDSRQANQKEFFANGKSGGYDLSSAAFKKYFADEMKLYVNDWGFHYIKADFLSYGSTASKTVPFDVSYREAIQIMTDALKPHAGYLMTCINHEWLSAGWADGQRLGNDVHGGDLTGVYVALKNWPRRYFTNRNFWNGDPDMLHVNLPTDEQAQVWASFVALSGGATMSGDSIPKLAPSRIAILKKTLPAQGITARPCDLFARPVGWAGKFPRLWNCPGNKPGVGQWNVVGVFNWTTDVKRDRNEWRGEAQNVTVDFVKDFGLAPGKRQLVYDFWRGQYLGAFQDSLTVGLPPASCRVLVLREEADIPQVLGSDRHIVSGHEDLKEARWDAGTRRLAGTTETVREIPYQLGLHVPAGFAPIQAEANGVKLEAQPDGEHAVRLVFNTGPSGKVNWSITFREKTAKPEPTAASTLNLLTPSKPDVTAPVVLLRELPPNWTDQRHDIEGSPIAQGNSPDLGATAPFWICWSIAEYSRAHPRLLSEVAATGEGKVFFEVIGDGQRLHATKVLGKGEKGALNVSVKEVKELQLICHYVDGWFSATRGMFQNPRLVNE